MRCYRPAGNTDNCGITGPSRAGLRCAPGAVGKFPVCIFVATIVCFQLFPQRARFKLAVAASAGSELSTVIVREFLIFGPLARRAVMTVARSGAHTISSLLICITQFRNDYPGRAALSDRAPRPF